MEGRRPAQPAHAEHHRRIGRRRRGRREGDVERAPEHRRDQAVGGLLGGRRRLHVAPVLEHGDRVAQGEHVAEDVRDVDHGHAVVAQLARDLQQPVGLVAGQRRGRLVHDDQPRVAHELAQDLDLLLVGRAQRPHGRRRARAKADALGQLGEALALLGAVDEAAAAQLDAEEDVVEDRQVGGERELLLDDPDAVADGVARRAMAHRLAVDEDLARVGRHRAGDDLAQRRLAGAVLAHERVDLARRDLEADVLQRHRGAVALVDAPHRARGARPLDTVDPPEPGVPAGSGRGRRSGPGSLTSGALHGRGLSPLGLVLVDVAGVDDRADRD